jgi:hypothetical protein
LQRSFPLWQTVAGDGIKTVFSFAPRTGKSKGLKKVLTFGFCLPGLLSSWSTRPAHRADFPAQVALTEHLMTFNQPPGGCT